MPAGLLPAGTEGIVGSSCVFPIPVNGRFVVKSKYFQGGRCVVTQACLAIFFSTRTHDLWPTVTANFITKMTSPIITLFKAPWRMM